MLSGGELDVERAEVGVRWWSEGGRELLAGDKGEGEKQDSEGAGREGTRDGGGHNEVAEARQHERGAEGEWESGREGERQGGDVQAGAEDDSSATHSVEDAAKRKPQSAVLLAKL